MATQVYVVGPWHVPAALQTSPCVHALPSLQGAPLGLSGHPLAGTHAAPVWHWPLHVTAVPPPQTPVVQVVRQAFAVVSHV